MESNTYSTDLRRHLAILRRWIWLIFLVTALFGAVAYLVFSKTKPVYEASTLLLVDSAPADGASDYTALQASERLARTYAELLTTQPVLEGVIERLGLEASPEELKRAIQVQPVRDTPLIDVRVEDRDPARSAMIANALGAVFADQNQVREASRYTVPKQNLEAMLAWLEEEISQAGVGLENLGEAREGQAERQRLESVLDQHYQLRAKLLGSYEQLLIAESHATPDIVQAEPALPPEKPIRPLIATNTALVAGLGLIFAIGSIYLIEALGGDGDLRSFDCARDKASS